MSDEITRFGTGERGTFKVERPKADKPFKLDPAILNRELECGTWWRNPETLEIEPYNKPPPARVHAVIQDTIDPRVTGKLTHFEPVFESRSRRRDFYRSMGQEIISGKEQLAEGRIAEQKLREQLERDESPRAHAEDWEKAGSEATYGQAPISEWERQQCREEARKLEQYKKRKKTNWAA